MICYLDTSALVKLYLEENGSDLVSQKAALSSVVATSRIAYAEAMAAFSRCRREGAPCEIVQAVISSFRQDWPCFFIIEATGQLVISAGELTEKYVLRGFDAIHLASILFLSDHLDVETLEVGCWDRQLWTACREAGLNMFPAESPGNS